MNITCDGHIEFEGGEGIYDPENQTLQIVHGNRHYKVKKNAEYYDPKTGKVKLKGYESGGIIMPIDSLEGQFIIPRKMILSRDPDENFARALALGNMDKVQLLIDKLPKK